ncbi:molybdopterin converting factor subunit 1 [Thermus filiformis]|jgi:molybdopterin synthase catalytic subunit|uniref:Molybdenum cofactor biosynthesis protein D/E n=1 Tax=Thermus filiformis TaxID=276 RepID=A0A0A2WQ29_THEFI|nr:molybdopterin converting factor subunit 1 [Thermus filiformis]KGQ21928.1 molybdenum cofactor biosynthesis protein D/E [Thermus filiformis]
MRVEVRLFALYREQAGQDRLSLALPEGARVKDLAEALKRRFPGLALEGGMAAVNQDLAGPDTPLKEGDEVAFLPPVSGGEGEENLGLTREPLDLKALVDWATRPQYGAVVSFLGTTRSPNRGAEVAFLEYEAYEEMALKTMRALVQEMRARFAIGRVALWHRLGRVEPSEASIAIVVSARHRKEAFLAAEYAIDRVKQVLPVWKKEYRPDGSFWVEGYAPEGFRL